MIMRIVGWLSRIKAAQCKQILQLLLKSKEKKLSYPEDFYNKTEEDNSRFPQLQEVESIINQHFYLVKLHNYTSFMIDCKWEHLPQ